MPVPVPDSGAPPQKNHARFVTMVLFVAGVPLAVILFTFVRQLADIEAAATRNPLVGVGATVMERIDRRLLSARQAVEAIAADPENPSRAQGHVNGGPFAAVALIGGDGAEQVMPGRFANRWGERLRTAPVTGISPLMRLDDGSHILVFTAPAADGGRVAAVMDVDRVLGHGLMAQLKLGRWGEAFVADGEGRVFLSARPHLLGTRMEDLDWTGGAGDGHWQAPDGESFFVAVAENGRWYDGPQQEWRVGLMVPTAVLAERGRNQKRWVVAIICAVVVITCGMAMVLRHSYRGKA